MNWKEIKVSEDQKYFLYHGEQLFDREFIEVLKFHAPGIAPVLDETGAYHINVQGKAMYEQRYSRTFGFYCNRAAIKSKNAWFHIDETGKRVYAESYVWVGNYQEDVCTVRSSDNSYFHIDLHGNRMYTENYRYAGDFKDDIACVKTTQGFQHIDKNGRPINGKFFHDLDIFHKGFATAKDDKGWFHIDKQGNELYTSRYLLIEPFYNGQALLTKFDGTKVVVDEAGDVVLGIV